jgi:hypothetical protein
LFIFLEKRANSEKNAGDEDVLDAWTANWTLPRRGMKLSRGKNWLKNSSPVKSHQMAWLLKKMVENIIAHLPYNVCGF